MDNRDNPTIGVPLPAAGEGAAAVRAPAPGESSSTNLAIPVPGSDQATMADPKSRATSPPTSKSSESYFVSAAVLQLGAVLGNRYEIQQLLGEGGMGAVYKARDIELDRLVALKVIRPELAGNPAILQRFKQELILARQVTHRNVIRIYDLGEADGIKFITMEYVEGEDLRTLLHERGKLPPQEAVGIIEQVCLALEAAHREGVIHRDLKPQNVMRDRQGRIVVMDFGLARSLVSERMTQTGAMVGTMEYMSPEQAMGGDLDGRSDLFTVGLIFFELVTGRMPYKAETALASLLKRTQERAIPISEIEKDFPERLSNVVSKCLERDPKARYQNVRELLSDLVGETHAPTPSRITRIMLPVPVGRNWLWGAGALILAVVLFFAIPVTRHLLIQPAATGVATPGIPSAKEGKYIAVLPFRVLGDQTSLGYVAEGLVEALNAKLFQMKELHVAASSEAEKTDTRQPLEKIGRELGENMVLTGTLQGSKDQMLVVVNLEDVANGRRVWSKEFPGRPEDLLTLEDQIYNQLVVAMSLKPSNEELARSSAHPTEDVDALQLYLRGREAMKGRQDPKNVETAIAYYKKALDKDNRFALAYSGLADASLQMYNLKHDPVYAQEAVREAQTAKQISPDLPEVHSALGSALNLTGQTASAIVELKKTVELAPNSDEGYRRLGEAYLSLGKKDEGLAQLQKATQINPYYWFNHNAEGTAYVHLGEFDKAAAEFQRVTELEPDNAQGWENLGIAYYDQGKWTQCIEAYKKALQISPDRYVAASNLGTVYFFLKRYPESVQMFEKAVNLVPDDSTLMGNLADAYRASGGTAKAMATYDRAISLALKELQVNPRKAGSYGNLGLYYAKKGDSPRAIEAIHQARTIDPNDVQLIFGEAEIQALAGHNKESLDALREALKKNYPAAEAENDPELDHVRGLPEFKKLIAEYSKKSK